MQGLSFCTQFKNTFAFLVNIVTDSGSCKPSYFCLSEVMIPSGKSISRWGFLRPFGPCMEDRHEHYQYRDSCPCRRWKDDLDGESAICQWSHFRTRERRKRDNEDGHLVFRAAAWDYPSSGSRFFPVPAWPLIQILIICR